MLTSALGDIAVRVDGAYCDVTLTSYGGVLTHLSERYYAYGGQVTLHDLGDLVEQALRSSGESYGEFTLKVGTGTSVHDSHTFRLLYCDRYAACGDTAQYLAENFLTTLCHRRVSPEDGVTLYLFAEAGASLAATVQYRYRLPDGSDLVATYAHGAGRTAATTGVQQVSMTCAILTADIVRRHGCKTWEAELTAFTVSVGQRSVTCHVDRSLRLHGQFAFRNCFNVIDVAALPVETTAKTEVDRSLAIFGSTSQHYDQTVNKSYEAVCGPLTSDEAEWIDQLVTAREAWRVEENPGVEDETYLFHPLLVTEAECEVSDGDDAPATVTLTWRYADNRARVVLRSPLGVFTDQYTLQYV